MIVVVLSLSSRFVVQQSLTNIERGRWGKGMDASWRALRARGVSSRSCGVCRRGNQLGWLEVCSVGEACEAGEAVRVHRLVANFKKNLPGKWLK